MELSQYIFPIYSGGTIVGQGFVADRYFITVAHVVKDFPDCFAVKQEYYSYESGIKTIEMYALQNDTLRWLK